MVDIPMFCSYTKFQGKDFVLAAKAAFVRDDRTVTVTSKDRFFQVQPCVFLPPDVSVYAKENLTQTPLPLPILKLINRNLSNIDTTTETRFIELPPFETTNSPTAVSSN